MSNLTRKPQSTGGISNSINILNEHLLELTKTINMLIDKINPILLPMVVVPDCKNEEEEEARITELASRVNFLDDIVVDLVKKVGVIVDRVDI
jgi:archaellum component FlaC